MSSLLLFLALLAAGPAETRFPGGRVTIPAGCTAPADIPMLIDAYLGLIDCPKSGLKMALFGGLMVGPPCEGAPDPGSVSLALPNGGELVVCAKQRISSDGSKISELIIDLGPGYLFGVVRRPADVVLMLSVAASFQRGRPGE